MMLHAIRLRELVEYDPETGVLTWRVDRNNQCKKGDVVGTVQKDGYRRTKIDGPSYLVHRLVWLYVHGEWPRIKLDHRNLNRDDNRISNLREATHAQNMQNQRNPHSHNRSSGVLGVHRCRNKWQAHIRVDGKLRTIGTFATVEEASLSYQTAKQELHQFYEVPA